jgi:hypothetical protein
MTSIGEAGFYIYNATDHKLVSITSFQRASFKNSPVLLVFPESRSDIRDPVPLHIAKGHWIPAFAGMTAQMIRFSWTRWRSS